ncbi:MAG: QueT transporter family protein [Candidatus Goldbacteria bacterium]|nr:QueT transporter family protein [Candidatus Goldiibacteriota bacterium]
MKEIFNVFNSTKQIVMVAITAAIYAGMLIPFKPIQIIPGLTELRPGSVIPVLFGVLFGPAAAWGSAIGNLIADFFGMLTLGSIFGFIGNFFFSYVAYKLWNILIKTEVILDVKQIGIFIFISIISSFVCAVIIGAGVEVIKLAPGMAIFLIIFINNSVMSSILGSILLKLLYKRIEKMGLIYKE